MYVIDVHCFILIPRPDMILINGYAVLPHVPPRGVIANRTLKAWPSYDELRRVFTVCKSLDPRH